ncbi:hypothetical protein KKC52_12515 [bacterium]|nr:hypothetical protein [bacterium]
MKEKKAFEALSYSRIKGDWGGEKVKKNKLDMVLELHHKTEGLLANIDSNAFQNLSVDLLNLSIRSSNCLRGRGIYTIGKLIRLSPEKLLRMRNFGTTAPIDVQNNLISFLEQLITAHPEPVITSNELPVLTKVTKEEPKRYFIKLIGREIESSRLKEIQDVPINELEVSVWSSNCLRYLDIKTVGDLIKFSPKDLLRTGKFVKIYIREMQEKLESLITEFKVILKEPSALAKEKPNLNLNSGLMSFSILQKTILDFFDISEKERDYIWNSFEHLRLANLDIPSDEWDRLHHHHIYQEDFLENILALSMGYIYKIWHDKTRFHEILNSVLNLVENALGYEVSFIPDVIRKLPAVTRENIWIAVYNFGYPADIQAQILPAARENIWIAVYNSVDDTYDAEKSKAKNKEVDALTIAIQNKFKQIFKTERDKGIINEGDLPTQLKWELYLSKHDKGIIKMRATGATLETVGQEYGLTRERVRQIERKVLDKFKFNRFLSRIKPHYILQTFTQSNTMLSINDIQSHLGELSEIFIYCLKKCNNKSVLWNDELNGFIIGDSSWYLQLTEYINTLPAMFEASDLKIYISNALGLLNREIDHNLLSKLILTRYNHTGNFYSKKKIYKADVYMAVLKRYYPDGIKLFDDFEMMRFRNYVKDFFGNVGLPENNRAICVRIADLAVLCGKGKYILSDQIRLDEEVLNNIHQFIIDSDRNVIMFVELFERFKTELLDKTSINNRFYLQGVLRYKYENEFYFTKNMLIKDTSNERDIKLLIEAFIKEQERIVTRDEIKEEFLGLSEVVLQSAITSNPNILLWDSGKYLHFEQLVVDNAVKERFKKILDNYTSQGSVSVRKIYHDIYVQENEFLMSNNIEGHKALYSVLNFWFPDNYEFSRRYIAPKGSTAITFDTVIRDYLSNFDEVYISDVKDYVESMRKRNFSGSAVLDDISDEFIRVDSDLLFRKDRLNLSEDVIESIEETTLALIGNTGYLSVKKPLDFLFYPDVGTKWTPFLLVSIVKYFCKRLKIISTVTDYRYLNEVIVDSSLNINNYDELLHYALSHEAKYTSFKSLGEMRRFLLEQELIANNIPQSLFDNGYIVDEEYGGIRLSSWKTGEDKYV